jgi:hypothetical protein
MKSSGHILPFLVLLGCGGHPDFGDTNNGGGSTPDGGGKGGPPATDSGGGGGNPADSGTPMNPMGPKLEIVSGQGATVSSGWPATDPLRVRALDANLQPVSGATITYMQSKGNGIHIQSFGNQETTDANGFAGALFNAFPLDANKGFEEDTVTASWNGLTADFDIVIMQVPSGQLAMPPLYQFQQQTYPDLGTAKAGTTISGGLVGKAVFQQGPSYGMGVPHWGLRLTKPNDLLSPSEVQCVGGTIIADAQGNGTCDIVVPKQPGDYSFTVLAGGALRWDSGHIHVVP